MEISHSENNVGTCNYDELERGVHAALETYSNVNRGSGHFSMATTFLYEKAREIVLEYLGLSKTRYTVIFCSPRRADTLAARLDPGSFRSVSGRDLDLPFGVRAMAVKKNALPKGTPFQTGGGTARLVSPGQIIWADAPDRFEAGTPAIINVIAFAGALLLMKSGNVIFPGPATDEHNAHDILYHDELESLYGQELLDALRQTIIGKGFQVSTVEGAQPFINLDNSASTPTFQAVWDVVRMTWRQPGSVQQDIIREVKSVCAGALDAPVDEYDVIFTTNATEAINLAAESEGRAGRTDTEPVVLSTLLEHSSNDLPWRMVPGASVIRLAVDMDGFIDLNELDTTLSGYNEKGLHGKKRISLVSVTGASNVLGTCNDLAEISRIVHRHGARLMVDAAQLAAHRKISVKACNIDFLAFSAHKVYAPFGCGVLVVKKGLLNFSTAEMENIRLSGEENAGGIAALGKALMLLQRIGMDLIREEEQVLTKRLLGGLAKIPGLSIYGISDPSSPGFSQKGGVIVFNLKGFLPSRLAMELALQGGIGVRFGCHCSHILIKHILGVPPAFQKLQGVILTLFPKLRLPGLVRVSLGIENNAEEVDAFLGTLERIALKSVPAAKEAKKQMDDFIRASARRVYFNR